MTDCNNVQTHYLEYVVRPQPDMIFFFNVYMSRERLKEEKKVNAMSIFKRRKKKYRSA